MLLFECFRLAKREVALDPAPWQVKTLRNYVVHSAPKYVVHSAPT